MVNQRADTVAASTMAVRPVPRPTTTPQSSSSCQSSVMNSEPTKPLPIRAMREDDDLADAEIVHEGGGEGTHQAEEDQPHGERGGDLRGFPAELVLQRLDEDAGRAHGAGGHQHGEEGGGDDHPSIVDVAPRQR